MPHLDVVVAALWPGEKLDPFIGNVKRTVRMPYTLHVLDVPGGHDAPATLSGAWNKLAGKGKGDLVAFMKTDVILPPAWDMLLSETLEAFPQVGVAIPAFFGDERPVKLVAEGPPAPLKEGVPGPSEMVTLTEFAEMFTGVIYLYEEKNAPFSCAMMQRSTWNSLEGFDERFRVFGHDHDFQDRMQQDTGQLAASVRSCPVYSRSGASSMEAILRIYADLGGEHTHFAAARELVSKEGPWHKLSPEARVAVRENVLYAKPPLSLYSLKLIQRKRSADV